jgi:ketosteroid isomerase-like protein
MLNRLLVLAVAIVLSLPSLAATKAAAKMAAAGGPDKAYLQKVLDGWSTMDPANMAQYYSKEDLLFFDIAPVKYANWQEYQTGVAALLKDYQSLKLTLGDDVQIHHEGNLAWAAATIKEEAVTKTGKHEMGTLRWTVILVKKDGNWLIVHEHTSAPLS